MPQYHFAIGAVGDKFRIDASVIAPTPADAVDRLKSHFSNEVEVYKDSSWQTYSWVDIHVDASSFGEQHIIRVESHSSDTASP